MLSPENLPTKRRQGVFAPCRRAAPPPGRLPRFCGKRSASCLRAGMLRMIASLLSLPSPNSGAEFFSYFCYFPIDSSLEGRFILQNIEDKRVVFQEEMRNLSLKSYCEENDRPRILQEWDAEKNLPLTPDMIAHTSATPVWWRCEKGHSWCTQVRSRSRSSTGCPVCRREWMEAKRQRQRLAAATRESFQRTPN